MTVTLPDTPATLQMSERDIRVELACALFARGKASSLAAVDIAGVGYDAFLAALQERKIPRYTSEMLREDIESLNHLFPDDPLPLPPR
jgi:predicted HTH domain antitoxin